MALTHKRISKNPNLGRFKLSVLVVRILVVLIILGFIYSQGHMVIARQYTYKSSNLPKVFNGYRIMHVSDIVNGPNSVVGIANKYKPDIILVTGNYRDSAGNSDKSVEEINKLADIAPTYYVYNPDDEENELASSKAKCLAENGQNGVIYLSSKYKLEDFEDFVIYNYGKVALDRAKNEEDENGIAHKELAQIREGFERDIDKEIVVYGYQTYKDYWNSLNDENNTNADSGSNSNKTYVVGDLSLNNGSSENSINVIEKESRTTPIEQDTYNFTQSTDGMFRIGVNGNENSIEQIAGTGGFDVILSGGLVDENGFQYAAAKMLSSTIKTNPRDIIGKDGKFSGYWPGIISYQGTDTFVSSGVGNRKGWRILNWPDVYIITLSDGTRVEDDLLTQFLKSLPIIGDVKDKFANDGGISEVTYIYKHAEGTKDSYTTEVEKTEDKDNSEESIFEEPY